MKKNILAVIIGSLLLCGTAYAENKVALVIGNSKYQNTGTLKNTDKDAKDMGEALKKAGFTVIPAYDADLDTMLEQTKKFLNALDRNSLGLFYYSGHGLQAGDVNYLLPIDAKIKIETPDVFETSLRKGAFDTKKDLLSKLERIGNPTNIIILDACRNNPFEDKDAKGVIESEGLKAEEVSRSFLIAYATAPGKTASSNGLGKNSLYTKYLKQYLFEPGLTIESALKKVSKFVKKESAYQVPWYNNSIDDEICLGGCTATSPTTPIVSNPANPPLISFVSGADSTNQNKSYTVKFKATDSDGDLSKITIDWGDGTTPTSKTAKQGAAVSFSHIYTFTGIFDLIATAIDKQKNESDTFEKSVDVKEVVTSTPVAPVITTPVVTTPVVTTPVETKPINSAPSVKKLTSSTAVAGQNYSLQLQASDTDKNLSLLTIDWGDGASNFENLSGASSTVSFSHVYANSGSFTWKTIVYDSNDATGSKSETLAVTQPVVTIVIPNVDNALATPSSIIAGNSTTFSATLSDNLPSGYSVKVDYGNGLISLSGSGTNYSVSATPIKIGSQTFKVGIYDSKGALKSNQITGNFSVEEVPVVVETPVETKPSNATNSTIKGNAEIFVSGDRTFSYTKIANDGSELPKTAKLGTGAKDWACTKDNNTGLIWEVKTTDGGLRDMNNTYTWYEPDASKNGGFKGYKYKNEGSCKGSDCDTLAYSHAVNAQGLCGVKDWRMPSKDELMQLVSCSDGKYNSDDSDDSGCTNSYAVTLPTINTSYFPNTPTYMFWSSSPSANSSDYAWVVSFYHGSYYGYGGVSDKYSYYNVRLVHTGQ